jgi:hypothetical protein
VEEIENACLPGSIKFPILMPIVGSLEILTVSLIFGDVSDSSYLWMLFNLIVESQGGWKLNDVSEHALSEFNLLLRVQIAFFEADYSVDS